MVESGNHNELLALNGHYARLWAQQRENSGDTESIKGGKPDSETVPDHLPDY